MEVEGDEDNEQMQVDGPEEDGQVDSEGDDQDRYFDSSGYDRLHNSLLDEIRGCEKAQLGFVTDDEGDEEAAFELEDESFGAETANLSSGGGDETAVQQNVGRGEEATGISRQGYETADLGKGGGDRVASDDTAHDEAGDAAWFLSLVGRHGFGSEGVENWLEGLGEGYEHLPGGINGGAGDGFAHIDLGDHNVPDSSDGGGGIGLMYMEDGDWSVLGGLSDGDQHLQGGLGEGGDGNLLMGGGLGEGDGFVDVDDIEGVRSGRGVRKEGIGLAKRAIKEVGLHMSMMYQEQELLSRNDCPLGYVDGLRKYGHEVENCFVDLFLPCNPAAHMLQWLQGQKVNLKVQIAQDVVLLSRYHLGRSRIWRGLRRSIAMNFGRVAISSLHLAWFAELSGLRTKCTVQL
ncbi:hypothetical protein LTR17_017754 [Elasticomyces elasticus]|nr:hypothetical protein LTR17_017754 [Elasticomyces elasticus]